MSADYTDFHPYVGNLTRPQPFPHKYKMPKPKNPNQNFPKTTALYSGNACNLVNLTVTWRLARECKSRDIDRASAKGQG